MEFSMTAYIPCQAAVAVESDNALRPPPRGFARGTLGSLLRAGDRIAGHRDDVAALTWQKASDWAGE